MIYNFSSTNIILILNIKIDNLQKFTHSKIYNLKYPITYSDLQKKHIKYLWKIMTNHSWHEISVVLNINSIYSELQYLWNNIIAMAVVVWKQSFMKTWQFKIQILLSKSNKQITCKNSFNSFFVADCKLWQYGMDNVEPSRQIRIKFNVQTENKSSFLSSKYNSFSMFWRWLSGISRLILSSFKIVRIS